MRKALLLATFLATAPLALATSVHDRNVAFIWSTLGDEDPLQPATMPDGRIVTLAEAVDEAAARAGSLDIGALAAGAIADPSASSVAGDVWVYEVGRGPCTRIILGPGSPIFTTWGAQLWIYQGSTAIMSTEQGDVTMILGWTYKAYPTRLDTAGFTLEGNTDLWCVEADDWHLAFPYANGEAHFN